MVPSDSQIYANLVVMMGPGNGEAGLPQRREARHRMIAELERLLPAYGIPAGGHLDDEGGIDRRSVYAGATTPTLYHKLESAFHTHREPRYTLRAVEHYQRGLVRAEAVFEDLHFLTVVVSREHYRGLAAHGAGMVPNTFTHGGLDQLGSEMRRMSFIPRDVIRRWRDLGPGIGCEGPGQTRCHRIQPASIPAADELMASAGVLRLRSDIFRQHLETEFGAERASQMLTVMTASQRRAWNQLAFARANGNPYRPEAGEAMFADGQSGLVTILDAAHHYETAEGVAFSLQAIFDEPRFARMTSVRIARARAVEAAVLDRYGLLTNASRSAADLVPAAPDDVAAEAP